MHSCYPAAFQKYILDSRETLHKYWAQHTPDSPLLTDHPIRSREDRFTSGIPLALHGDGVSVTGLGKVWQQGVDVYSIHSLLPQTAGTRLRHQVIALVPVALLGKDAESQARIDVMHRHLAWSLQSLGEGVWPRLDPDGQSWPQGSRDRKRAGRRLAGHFYAAVIMVKGDLDFLWKGLRLPSFSSNSPCGLCRCGTQGLNAWWNISPNASWVTRQADHVHRSSSPLFRAISRHSICPDWLHSKHLGTDAYIAASVMTLLSYELMPSAPSRNCCSILQFLKAYARGQTINKLKLYLAQLGFE